MNALLFIVAFFLGFPLVIGVWLAGVKLFKLASNHMNDQSAFVLALCVIAGVLSLLTAPVWLLGWQGYAVVCAVYVAFVGYGAPHIFRVLRFLALELDANPNNDVPLPGDDNVKKN